MSIQSRLNQIVDEGSTVGQALTEWYNEHNIAVYDQEGQLRNLYDILSDVAEIWPSLTRNEQAYYANTQAGANQTQNLTAILGNFQTAIDATSTALNSAGSAARENAAYMDSIQAKLTAVESSFQQLASSVIDSDLTKFVLDLAKAFLDLLNTPIGTFITQVGLLIGLIWGGKGLITALNLTGAAAKDLQKIFAILTGATKAQATASTAAAGATTTLGTAMNTALPIIGIIAGGIAALVAVVDAFTVSAEEQAEVVNNLATELSSLESEYQALSSQSDLTEIDERRLKVLERQIELEKEQLELEKQRQYEITYSAEGTGKNLLTDHWWEVLGLTSREINRTGEDLLWYRIDTYEDLEKQLTSLDEAYISLDKSSEDYAKQAAKNRQEYQETSEELQQVKEDILEIGGGLYELVSSMENPTADMQRFARMYENWLLETGEASQEGGEEIAEGFNTAQIGLENFVDSSSSLTSTIETLQEAYNSLTDIVETYNETGVITYEQLQTLTEMDSEYAGMLELVNGKLVLNSNKLYEAAQQARQKAIEDAKITAAQQMQEIALNGVQTAMEDSATAADEAKIELSDYLTVINQVTTGATTAAAAVAGLNVSLMREGNERFTEEQKAAMQAVLDNFNNFVDLVNSTDLISPFSQDKTTGGKGSEEVDPIKAQADAFDELNKNMEFNIWLREQQGASEEELIELNRQYQNQLHEQAEWFRGQGLDETSEYVQNCIREWWSLYDTIKDLQDQSTQKIQDALDEQYQATQDYINQREVLNDWGTDSEILVWERYLADLERLYQEDLITYEQYIEKKIDATEQLKNAVVDNLNSQISDYQTMFGYMTGKIQDELDSLQDAYDAEEQYWDNRIQAVQDANAELERQIELEEKLDALARAKQSQVMVYQDGRFQYVQDIDAVNEAQAELEAYERQATMEREVEALERQKEIALRSIKEQIEAYEEWLKAWSEAVDRYQEEQDELIAEQVLGIKLEEDNWKTRLDNLELFVAQYNALLTQLGSVQGGGVFGSSSSGGGSSGGGGGVFSASNKAALDSVNEVIRSGGDISWWMIQNAGKVSNSIMDYANSKRNEKINNTNSSEQKYSSASDLLAAKGYASGTTNAIGGLHTVGENGPELRVLNSGDGILPADITKNLWAWGATTPSSFMSGFVGSGVGGENIYINIDTFNPNLPNVTNGEQFADYMRTTFWRKTLQYQTTR